MINIPEPIFADKSVATRKIKLNFTILAVAIPIIGLFLSAMKVITRRAFAEIINGIIKAKGAGSKP